MKYTYEVPLDINGNASTEFIYRTDGLWIPIDEANSDYQAYLNKDKPQVEHFTENSTK